MNFKFVKREGSPTTLTITDYAGNIHVADSSHAYWNEIKQAVLDDDEERATDIISGRASFSLLDNEAFSLDDYGVLRFRGERLEGSIAKFLEPLITGRGDGYNIVNADVLSNGENYETVSVRNSNPLVAFMEKAFNNPAIDSVSQLFDWLGTSGLHIDHDGYFYGYKGVRADGKSVTAGEAFVNGEHVRGNIPNEVGDVISMHRDMVTLDRNIACGPGLHVGAWSYAQSFTRGRTLLVRVNPADVVSVPTDYGYQKLRVTRYEVVSVIETPLEDTGSGRLWDDEDDFESLENLRTSWTSSDDVDDSPDADDPYYNDVDDYAECDCAYCEDPEDYYNRTY